MLLALYEKCDSSTLRGCILQCLGFLFRAQLILMTLERSTVIMDEIFASPEEKDQGRPLKITYSRFPGLQGSQAHCKGERYVPAMFKNCVIQTKLQDQPEDFRCEYG